MVQPANKRLVTEEALADLVHDSRIYYTGTSWPSRASSVPLGYTGPMEYFSAGHPGAPSPTDQQVGDIWTRRAATT